jgi:hypothetical protein
MPWTVPVWPVWPVRCGLGVKAGPGPESAGAAGPVRLTGHRACPVRAAPCRAMADGIAGMAAAESSVPATVTSVKILSLGWTGRPIATVL